MTTETERAKRLASDRQVGGNHYKDMPIEPAEFCQRNQLNWCEANVVKYVCRHRDKKGAEDIRKAIHYLELLLEWEYPLPPEEVERTSGEHRLCTSCAHGICEALLVERCDETGQCDRYVSSLRERIAEAKEDAHSYEIREANGVKLQPGQFYHIKAEAKEPQALDLSLPSITLECTAEEAHRKYAEENAEWLATDIGTMEELIERWDCLQVLNTYLDRGGDAAFVMDEINYITHDLKAYAAKGAKLMEAKAAAILKNALRGYYAPVVNQIIIASNGERWK
jgi:hypothetical protein